MEDKEARLCYLIPLPHLQLITTALSIDSCSNSSTAKPYHQERESLALYPREREGNWNRYVQQLRVGAGRTIQSKGETRNNRSHPSSPSEESIHNVISLHYITYFWETQPPQSNLNI
jgi:hypothetical protein